MKILQLGKYFSPEVGGMENFVVDLTEKLSQKLKCDVLCFNSKNKTVIENRKNYKVIKIANFGELSSIAISPTMVYWLKKIGNKYDIIHLHLPNPIANLAYFLTRPNSKLVLHWHSDIVRQKKLLFFYQPLQNWLLKKAEAIIATSPNYLENSKYLSQYKNKCLVIPLGLNPHRLTSNKTRVRDLKKEYPKKPIIFSAGRFVYYKGYQYLIEAIKKIDAYLLIAGSGPLKNKLRKQIKTLGLEKKVFLLGKVQSEDLGNYYRACDIFCLPSIHKSEAFGLVQLEAMYFGKPIISTDIKESGVKWVNQNNLTGILVPPKNSQALAEAINKLIKNPKLKKRFGDNGKRRLEEKFRIERVVNEILKLYNEIIYGKKKEFS